LDGQAYAKQKPLVKKLLLVLVCLALTYAHPLPNQVVSLESIESQNITKKLTFVTNWQTVKISHNKFSF
jgi:hypothetical protein